MGLVYITKGPLASVGIIADWGMGGGGITMEGLQGLKPLAPWACSTWYSIAVHMYAYFFLGGGGGGDDGNFLPLWAL